MTNPLSYIRLWQARRTEAATPPPEKVVWRSYEHKDGAVVIRRHDVTAIRARLVRADGSDKGA